MYPPPHHQVNDRNKMIEVIKQYPLSMIVSFINGDPQISHIPLIYNDDSSKLIGHMDGNNPQVESLQNGNEVFNSEYTAEMEKLLDNIAEGAGNACVVWERMRDEFKAAHESARQAGLTGMLLPSTRHRLEEYLRAKPELADEIGGLDEITQQAGQKWVTEFRARGVDLLPSEKQKNYLVFRQVKHWVNDVGNCWLGGMFMATAIAANSAPSGKWQ